MSLSPGRGGQTPAGRWLARLLLLLLIAYPLALHLGVLHQRLGPAWICLLALLLLSGGMMVGNGRRSGWLLLATALAGALWVSLYQGDPATLLRLPPVLINGLLGLLFGSTLLPHRRPLISRFAELMHGHALDETTRRYTRGVTLLWTLLFAALTLESLLLGLFAPPAIWSLFTHFINTLVVLLVFFVEYQVRLRRLAHLEHPGFTGFMLALRRIDWRRLV